MKGVAEYAKSARAGCRHCSDKIDRGSLRLGLVERSPGGFDATRWFHPCCFFKAPALRGKAAPAPSALSGFSSLKDSAVEMQLRSILASFALARATSDYKGIPLPAPWRAFQSVIFHPGDSVEPNPRIAAFDFDGCLAKTDVRIMGPKAWSLQFPSVPKVLKEYHSKGYKLVVFTNESSIDRFTKARKKAMDSKLGRLNALMELLELPMQVFVSCAKSSAQDPFRKPAHGMWRLLEQLNGGVPVDMEQSFYVGDAAGREEDHSDADIGFAKALGLEVKVPEDVFHD